MWLSYNKGVSDNSKNVKPQQWLFFCTSTYKPVLESCLTLPSTNTGQSDRPWLSELLSDPGPEQSWEGTLQGLTEPRFSPGSWRDQPSRCGKRRSASRLSHSSASLMPRTGSLSLSTTGECSRAPLHDGMMLECTGTASALSMPN